MNVTSVDTILARMKRLYDYDITDSDLTNLLIDCLNNALKIIQQSLFDAGIYKDVSALATLTTTDQEYIDVSSTPVDLDEMIFLSERTNDLPIDVISYTRYIELYPDPTADKATTPDHGALFNGKLYLGPTPSTAGISIYLAYIKLLTEVAAGGNLPFSTKYDPLIIAGSRIDYLLWKHSEEPNAPAVVAAQAIYDKLEYKLITGAKKNLNMNRQTKSRREDGVWPGPKKADTSGYGWGVGGWGVGGWGG